MDLNIKIRQIRQIKGKILNQTWEKEKKPNFRPDFGPFDPNFDPQIHICEFYLY